jgi:hypothetical protein
LNRSKRHAGELSPCVCVCGGGDGNGGGLNAVRGNSDSVTGVGWRRGKEGGVAPVAMSGRERGGKREGAGVVADAF